MARGPVLLTHSLTLTHLLEDVPDGRFGPGRRLLVELVPLVDTLEVDRVCENHEPLGVLRVDLVSGER